MSKTINNNPAYVFKNMLHVILNGEESIRQVARAVNGYLFYSLPQKGSVTIGSTNDGPEEIRLTAGDNKSIDDVLALMERDKVTTVTFFMGEKKVIKLQRYQKTRFEIIVFED